MNYKTKTKGRIRLTSDYRITGNVKNDIEVIPRIIAQIWTNHCLNVSNSEMLLRYYFNDTDIKDKSKIQRPDINNKISVPTAYEVQRKINSYANGLPRTYTALDGSKQNLVQIFNNYQINECKHSKIMKANYFASICGVGYYCVLPDYNKDSSTFEIYSENFSPLNTFIVYENSMRGEEMLAANYFTKQVIKDGVQTTVTEFNVFTKYHQFVFETLSASEFDFYTLKMQYAFNPLTKLQEYVEAIPNTLGIIPIVEVCYHPFRLGIFEIIIDLLDCVNLFLSGDLDARQQAIDYVLVMTDCEFAIDEDENGNEVPKDINSRRLISIKSNGGTNNADVKILSNNFDSNATIRFIEFINYTIEKIVGIPTRKSQDIGGNSSTGTGAKNENGMRDLDDNADIIESQALLSERKYIKLVIAIDEKSPSKKLSGLNPIDIKVSFPRNEVDNILTTANAYSIMRGAGYNDEDTIAFTKVSNDVIGTAERNRKEKQIDIQTQTGVE